VLEGGAADPAAAETLVRDWERMVTFYDFPREHWKHLRTTNPVESPFAAVCPGSPRLVHPGIRKRRLRRAHSAPRRMKTRTATSATVATMVNSISSKPL
jgi:hypothetical protein